MTDYNLQPSGGSIGLNDDNTIGIMPISDLPENKRTITMFSPYVLKEWAEAVEDCYTGEGVIEIVFHKDAPMLARVKTDADTPDASVGIAACPRLLPEDYNDRE